MESLVTVCLVVLACAAAAVVCRPSQPSRNFAESCCMITLIESELVTAPTRGGGPANLSRVDETSKTGCQLKSLYQYCKMEKCTRIGCGATVSKVLHVCASRPVVTKAFYLFLPQYCLLLSPQCSGTVPWLLTPTSFGLTITGRFVLLPNAHNHSSTQQTIMAPTATFILVHLFSTRD